MALRDANNPHNDTQTLLNLIGQRDAGTLIIVAQRRPMEDTVGEKLIEEFQCHGGDAMIFSLAVNSAVSGNIQQKLLALNSPEVTGAVASNPATNRDILDDIWGACKAEKPHVDDSDNLVLKTKLAQALNASQDLLSDLTFDLDQFGQPTHSAIVAAGRMMFKTQHTPTGTLDLLCVATLCATDQTWVKHTSLREKTSSQTWQQAIQVFAPTFDGTVIEFEKFIQTLLDW